MKKITFSEEVKEELCNNQYDSKYTKYLLYSFFKNSLVINLKDHKEWWTINTNYGHVIRLIKRLLLEINPNFNFKILKKDNVNSSSKAVYQIYIDKHLDELNQFLELDKFKESDYKKILKRYFIIGSFLSSGSISFSKTKHNYHFEIRSNNQSYLEVLKKFLQSFDLDSKIISFRNQYKLYIKKVGSISDILKIMNALESMYKLEDYRIKKDFTTSLQRLNNLDVANIKKTAIASSNQIKWINTIINNGCYEELDNKEKMFSDIRIKYPHYSLNDISDAIYKQYNIIIPRTSLNHIINRIKKKYYLITSETPE